MFICKTADKYTNGFNPENVNNIFARGVRARRKQLGLSQERLSFDVDTHANYISGIECFQRNPTAQSMAIIADALEVPLFVLLWQDYIKEEINYSLVKIGNCDYDSIDVNSDKWIETAKDKSKEKRKSRLLIY